MSYSQPARIDPDAIYDDRTAALALRLSCSALSEGRRDGSLRHRTIGRKHIYFGRWLRDWLEVEDMTGGRKPPVEEAAGVA